jgi:DNA-directed RNA polymerase subunit M/transcription elongation factor TFIIS
MDTEWKRRIGEAVRRRAEEMRCPDCGRMAAMISALDGQCRVCRWCGYRKRVRNAEGRLRYTRVK